MRLAAVLTLAILGVACTDESTAGFARAYQATSRAQLVGGLAAVADVGDFVLENDEARFVILGAHGSPGPGIFGGSLADADLQRLEPEFRGGNGLDSFSELFPFANLATPNPEKTGVVVLDAGGPHREASIEVNAKSDNYMDALEVLKLLGVHMDIRMLTRYRLRPGERVLRIETVLEFDPSPGSRPLQAMEGLTTPPSIFGTILRIPLKDAALPDPGAVAGDFLFFGNKTSVFTPEYGFDLDTKLREIFNGGCDSVNVPVGVHHLAAEGDRVSYAYGSADTGGGRVYVPLFASSFTAVMTNKTECTGRTSCLAGVRLSFSRFFAVGDGDVASAQRELYRARNDPFGTVRGHVYDARTGGPVSDVRVFAQRDPGTDKLSDAALASGTPEQSLVAAYAANLLASRTCDPNDETPANEGDPDSPTKGEDCRRCLPENDRYGASGIVTSMRTDRGTDRVRDGDFTGPLPPGRYLLFARDRLRPTSRLVRVEVKHNTDVEANLWLEPPGTLEVHVTDEAGRPMPGKVTLGRCLPDCAHDADCAEGARCNLADRRCIARDGRPAHTYESCTGGTCTCEPVPFVDLSLGDPTSPDHVLATGFAGADGVARLSVRPGEYEVVVSRGFEYDLSRHDVTLDPHRPTRLLAPLHRVVDTTGWVSADFHVHGILSHDANVTHERRVLSMMGEGVELASSADHDAIADFVPAIRRLGADRFLKGQSGLETTTVELGHFIGAPLRYDELVQGTDLLPGRGGAFDWDGLSPGAADFCDTDGDGAFDRRHEKLIPRGSGDCEPGVTVGHDLGMTGRLRALGLFGGDETVITVPHPRDGFFGYFDQFDLNPYTMVLGPRGATLETFNPLVKPGFFSTDFDAIELFNGKRYDFVRTPTYAEVLGFKAEMDAARDADLPNAELEVRFAAAGEKWAKVILERTADEQRSVMSSRGLEACLTEPRPCDLTTLPPSCPGTQTCERAENVCYQGCSDVHDCFDVGQCVGGRCVTPPEAPCTAHRGVVDDWFRLLNGGFAVTGTGNSDSHTTLSTESGVPRNWLRSSTDEPGDIDLREAAASVREHAVVTSYGPFVRLEVNGTGIGGTVRKPSLPVKIHVSVESPLWFDVDRLELYRNAQVLRTVDALPFGQRVAECSRIDTVPNRETVHFDCTFADTPDRDSWYVAIALGLRGKDLRPVYTSVPLLNLEIGDITGRAFGAFGLITPRPEIPRQNPVLPLAVTNPVWVDLAGDGFDAPEPLPEASPFSRPPGAFPLSSTAISPDPGEPSSEWTQGRALAAMRRRLARALEAHHGHQAQTRE